MNNFRKTRVVLPPMFVEKLPAGMAEDAKKLDDYLVKELVPRLAKATLGQPLKDLLKSSAQLTELASGLDRLGRLKVSAPTGADYDDLAVTIHQSHMETMRDLAAMLTSMGEIENHLADFLHFPSGDALLKLHADANEAVTHTFAKLDETTVLGPDHTLALLLIAMDAVSPLPSRKEDLLTRLAYAQKQIPEDRMIGVPTYRKEMASKNLSRTGTAANPKLGDQTETIENLAPILGSVNKVALALLDAQPDEGQARIKSGALCNAVEQLIVVSLLVHDFRSEAIYWRQATRDQPDHIGILMGAERNARQLEIRLERVLQCVAGASWVCSPVFLAALNPLLAHAKSSVAEHPSFEPGHLRMVAFLQSLGVVDAKPSEPPPGTKDPVHNRAPDADEHHEDQVKRLHIQQAVPESNLEQLLRAFQNSNQFAPGKQPSLKDGSIVTDAKGVALTREQFAAAAEFIRTAFGPGTVCEWKTRISEKPKKSVETSGPGEKLFVAPYRLVGPHIMRRLDSDRSKYKLFQISNDCFRLEQKKCGGKFHANFRNRLTQELIDSERARQLQSTDDAAEIRPRFKEPASILNSVNSARVRLEQLGYTFESTLESPLAEGIFLLTDPRSSKARSQHQKGPVSKRRHRAPKLPEDAKILVDLVQIVLEARNLVRAQLRLKRPSQQIQPTAKSPIITVPLEAQSKPEEATTDARKPDCNQPLNSTDPKSTEGPVRDPADQKAIPTDKPHEVREEASSESLNEAPLGSTIPKSITPPGGTPIKVTDPPVPSQIPRTAGLPLGAPPVAETNAALSPVETFEATSQTVATPVAGAAPTGTQAADIEPRQSSTPPALQSPPESKEQPDKIPGDTTHEPTSAPGPAPVEAVLGSRHPAPLGSVVPNMATTSLCGAPQDTPAPPPTRDSRIADQPTGMSPAAETSPMPTPAEPPETGRQKDESPVPVADPTKDTTAMVPDQNRCARDESEPVPATEFRPKSALLAKLAGLAASVRDAPDPAAVSTAAPVADIRSSLDPTPDSQEHPVRNAEDGKTPPADTSLIPGTDAASHGQFGVTQEPFSLVNSNLRSPAAQPRIEPGEVQRAVPPPASESRPASPPSQAAENPEGVRCQSRPEAIHPALDHGSPTLPELTYYVPELLIAAAEEAARSGHFEMLQSSYEVAHFLASIGWPLAGESKDSRENELILRYGGGKVNLRLDETLFVLQLALARGRMRAYPTWNFDLHPMLGRDQECQIERGPGGFLKPFHIDLIDLDNKLKNPIFAASWMFRSRMLDYSKQPLEIAAEFWSKFARSEPKLAVLLTALHYRTHQFGYLNFDTALRKMCYHHYPWPPYLTKDPVTIPV